jgi:hypothetical protein
MEMWALERKRGRKRANKESLVTKRKRHMQVRPGRKKGDNKESLVTKGKDIWKCGLERGRPKGSVALRRETKGTSIYCFDRREGV